MEQFIPNLIFDNESKIENNLEKQNEFLGAGFAVESFPATLDMRDLVLQTENQGQTSMCAAYTATSWLESIMWRKTGKPVHYDAAKLYKHAKSIDGNPNCEGTTLPAIMQALIDLNWSPTNNKEDIVLINSVPALKRAIHRYGTCLLGFMITDSWYKHVNKLVFDDISGKGLGGHAVICVGYNDVGVLIQNSWGQEWGKYGFACITWDVFDKTCCAGAYFKNALNNLE